MQLSCVFDEGSACLSAPSFTSSNFWTRWLILHKSDGGAEVPEIFSSCEFCEELSQAEGQAVNTLNGGNLQMISTLNTIRM